MLATGYVVVALVLLVIDVEVEELEVVVGLLVEVVEDVLPVDVVKSAR